MQDEEEEEEEEEEGSSNIKLHYFINLHIVHNICVIIMPYSCRLSKSKVNLDILY